MNGPHPPFNGINLISGSPTVFTIPWHHLLLQAGRNDQFFNSKGGGEEREKKYQRKESSIFASPCKGTRRGINSNFWMDGGPRFCRKKKKKKTRSKLATVVQRNYTCHVNIHKRRIRQTVRTMPSLRYLAYTCGKNCHFIEPRVPAVFKRNSARGKMRFVALTFFLSFFFVEIPKIRKNFLAKL